MVCGKVVCERWCVAKLWVTVVGDKEGSDQVACDKVVRLCVVVCERWCVAKLCVKDGVWQSCG